MVPITINPIIGMEVMTDRLVIVLERTHRIGSHSVGHIVEILNVVDINPEETVIPF